MSNQSVPREGWAYHQGRVEGAMRLKGYARYSDWAFGAGHADQWAVFYCVGSDPLSGSRCLVQLLPWVHVFSISEIGGDKSPASAETYTL